MTKGPHWYIAYVRPNMERKVLSTLNSFGVECYLPVQKELRQYSDRKKQVERLVLPRMIFIRCQEHERIPILQKALFIRSYMSDGGGAYSPAVVPDAQMEAFRLMVDHGRRVQITDREFVPGEKVRIVSGPLAGLECELVSVSGKRCIAIKVGSIGQATMDLETENMEPLESQNI